MRVSNTAIQDLEKTLQGPDVQSRIVDAAVKASKDDTISNQQPTNGAVSGPTDARASPATDPSQSDSNIKSEEQQKIDLATSINAADLSNGTFFEDNVNSGIYPYNAFRHPFTHLKRPADADPKLFASRLQRLLIPTLMPLGLDAHQVLNERDRYVEARMQQRIRELEALPSTIGDGGLVEDNPFENELSIENKENAIPAEQTLRSLIIPPPTAHGKLRAAIELKSLRLLDKQRALRALVAERLAHGSMLPLSRTEFRRVKKPTIRDARMTEQLERKQRAERERRAKHKHVEQLEVICNHGREVMNACRNAQDRVLRIGRAVLSFHAHTEKEEQKRIERLAKERLKALKADDEEAYMKLIDTAKDTRITHLLKQTDAYLDSLAQAVVAQQTESGVATSGNWESEEGPTSEATFGAKAAIDDPTEDRKSDYYAVAHRMSERITQQPKLLIGGTLKEYQLKGLQWMVSLYNNRLNGILADEMVSIHTSANYLEYKLCVGSRQNDSNHFLSYFSD